jgi:hypothetical protein
MNATTTIGTAMTDATEAKVVQETKSEQPSMRENTCNLEHMVELIDRYFGRWNDEHPDESH